MRLALLGDGASVHLQRWAAALGERGHDVSVFSMRPAPASGPYAHHTLRHAAPAGFALNAPELRGRLRALSPDLLHVHYAGGYGTLGTLSGFRPRIVSIWGSDVEDFPERGPLHRLLLRRTLRSADRLCATSRALRDRTRDLLDEARPVSVVPFGVDLERFVPRRRAARGSTVVGTVKTLWPHSGVDVLLRAFALLVERSPGLDLELWVVGDGVERSRYEALARRLEVGARVSFAGEVASEAVPALIAEMDIFALPSRREGFGVSAIEAGAAGLPVVASRVGGLPEVIEDGWTGLLVPPEDPKALADALEGLAADAALREAIGARAREKIEREFDWAESVTRMEHVYGEVCDGTHRVEPM